MALADDLARIASLAAQYGDVGGVLAAEPTDERRLYLVAFGSDDDRGWLVLDDDGRIVDGRDEVRAAASIVAMSELVAELAGVDDEPRLAKPAYLDEVGGEVTDSLPGSTGVVQAFVEDVLQRYLGPLG